MSSTNTLLVEVRRKEPSENEVSMLAPRAVEKFRMREKSEK
jgi:hypothetical protein